MNSEPSPNLRTLRHLPANAHGRLQKLVVDAARNVPFYEQRYQGIDVNRRCDSAAALLRRLPIVTKNDLLNASQRERVHKRYRMGDLISESTTGSTGQPFTICFDRRYLLRRNMRFLWGLVAAGYRPWHRLMLLTDRYATPERRRKTWHYVPIEQSATDIARTYEALAPQVLYGFTTPLRMLAEAIGKHSTMRRLPQRVISTAEMMDAETRQIIEQAFRCPVYDFYGMTEMGLVARQCPGEEGYILDSASIIAEFVPKGGDLYGLVMTNLDLKASPMIRYDSGDLVRVDSNAGQARITHFEGRAIDTLVRADGEELSPYRITDELRGIRGLNRFQIIQHDIANISVHLDVDANLQDSVLEHIRLHLQSLLGQGIQIEIIDDAPPLSASTAKFRPIVSHVERT